MPIQSTELSMLPHAVFLRRVAGARPTEASDAKLGQGAFLALRLIDLLGPPDASVHPDAFEYQWTATDRFCRGLGPGTESAHLRELVASAIATFRRNDIRLLTPAFFAYAHYLEDALHLEEALDVLGTLRAVIAQRLTPVDAVALSLREGRVNRKLNRFDAADAAYGEACTRARSAGDRYSDLLGRIGRANTLLGRGNLPEAERQITNVLADARKAGERDAEARAEHGLAVVLQHRGSPDAALKHMWRAFELYEEEDSRLRALNDVGVMLLTLGDAIGAHRALQEVVRRGGMKEKVTNALIELMHCASFQRDRVGFERYRAECHASEANMPPNMLADFYLKAGIGEARFSQFRRAATTLAKALKVAEDAALHSFVFKIERIRNGLSECEAAAVDTPATQDRPVWETETLREVSASVALLVEQHG